MVIDEVELSRSGDGCVRGGGLLLGELQVVRLSRSLGV